MFYTVSEDTEQILEVSRNCPDVQEQADYFKCAVYIIDGQHSGLTAQYHENNGEQNALPYM